MSQIFAVFLFLLLQVSILSAQHGKECSVERPCRIHQNCYVGYCVCEPGYIRATENCFPVRKYGERCYYDEQCIDHRMNCLEENTESNGTRKICRCDRFHEWNELSQDCIYTQNVTELLGDLVGKDVSIVVMKEADKIFSSLGWVGVSIAVLLLLLGMILLIYGCCLYECYDKCTVNSQILSRCPPSCPNYRRTDFASVT